MSKKIRQVWSGAVLSAIAVCVGVSAATAQPQDLVLEGGTLIDGTGSAPITDAVIVVHGGRITAVGKKGQIAIPATAHVIDTTGRTILPGLIDTHVHTQEWMPPMFLPYGVTTVVDANNDPAWILAQREMLRSGKINGPRMFVSGAGIGGTLAGKVVGQFNTPIAATAQDVKTIARNNVAAGFDVVHVQEDLTADQLSAAIEAAKESGEPALGHVRNIRWAAQLGFKIGEHTWTMARALLDPDDKNPSYTGSAGPGMPKLETLVDPKTFPSLVDYLVKQGVYLNPHLTNEWRGATPLGVQFAQDATEILKDPGLAFLPAELRPRWVQPLAAPAGYDNVKEFLRQFAMAGGKVTAGTDTGFGGHAIPGLYVHYEMRMFVQVGYTPMQAIQAATLWNAEVLQKTKDLGSIAPGKIADFVIIQGNPLTDISVTRNVRMVIKDGKVMDTRYDPKWANPIPQPYSTYQGYAPVPSVSALTPSILRRGGQTVTLQIEGGKFTPNAVARFDNTDLPTTFVSSNKLTATLDDRLLQSAPGAYPVYVVNPGIHGTVSSAAYAVIATPGSPPATAPKEEPGIFGTSKSLHQVSGLSPRMAPQAGRTVQVEIQGPQFAPNSIVRFDNAQLPTRFVSSTKLIATIDAKLLQRPPGSYVLYILSPGPQGHVSPPAYFLVGLKS